MWTEKRFFNMFWLIIGWSYNSDNIKQSCTQTHLLQTLCKQQQHLNISNAWKSNLSSFCLLGFRSRCLNCLHLLLRQGQGSGDGVRPGWGEVHQGVNSIPEERKRRGASCCSHREITDTKWAINCSYTHLTSSRNLSSSKGDTWEYLCKETHRGRQWVLCLTCQRKVTKDMRRSCSCFTWAELLVCLHVWSLPWQHLGQRTWFSPPHSFLEASLRAQDKFVQQY